MWFSKDFARLLIWIPLLASTMLAGCSNESDQSKVYRREGWAEKIDTKSKTVSMRMRLKNGEEKMLDGTYSEDTVVMINGRNMEIKDIKPGDPIEVFGVRNKEAGGTTLVATKVIVTRKEKEFSSTGKSRNDEGADGEPSKDGE